MEYKLLPAYGSCSLGSINLAAFVNDEGKFDWDDFNNAVGVAIEAQNDVLDEGLLKHPLIEQQQCVTDWRQIGIGIMGLADCLIKMKLKYGSKESLKFCDSLGKDLAIYALTTSASLAQEKGAYPKYNSLVLQSEYFKNHCSEGSVLYNAVEKYGLRNSQLLTIAPTGLTIVAQYKFR